MKTLKGKNGLAAAARRRWLVDKFLRDYRVPERMVLSKRPAMVKRLRRAGYGDDITSVCWLALVESAEKFDPKHGVKFSSYAFVNQVWRCARLLEKGREFTAGRDRSRDDGRDDNPLLARFDALPSREPPPERATERDDMGEFVRRTVEGCVTPHQWETMAAVAGVGRERAETMREVAKWSGVSYQAVQQTVSLAAERVRSTVTPRVAAELKEGCAGD